jgi:hypothetical protein
MRRSNLIILGLLLLVGCKEQPVPPAAPPNPRAIVKVTIVHPAPAIRSTYTITPEVIGGDKYSGFRAFSWVPESPGAVAKAMADHKEKTEFKPVPAVSNGPQGTKAEAGGGSKNEESGAGFFAGAWSWLKQQWGGWTMFFILGGLGIGLVYLLAPFVPLAATIAGVITGLFRMVWSWIKGIGAALSKLFQHTTVTPPTPTVPPVTTGVVANASKTP